MHATHAHISQKTHQDAVISTVDGIITQIMICVSMFRVHRRCRNLSQGSNYRPSSITPATVLACCHSQWPSLFSFISSKASVQCHPYPIHLNKLIAFNIKLSNSRRNTLCKLIDTFRHFACLLFFPTTNRFIFTMTILSESFGVCGIQYMRIYL